MPGQTCLAKSRRVGCRHPSMEGRTIARPDRRARHIHPTVAAPSMEGRTIARPDAAAGFGVLAVKAAFNGGPDNCPARPDHLRLVDGSSIHLQWRAGQLPGQTGGADRHRVPCRIPSMEGRTIARPDPWPLLVSLQGHTAFNGGPDNCPARPITRSETRPVYRSFNGGPDNCPARRASAGLCRWPWSTFNGGPDNCPARPRRAVRVA